LCPPATMGTKREFACVAQPPDGVTAILRRPFPPDLQQNAVAAVQNPAPNNRLNNQSHQRQEAVGGTASASRCYMVAAATPEKVGSGETVLTCR